MHRFADVVATYVDEDSIVWVHDYQLMLVPYMLRRLKPNAKIGYFHHVPFPSSEVFRILPWRAQLLQVAPNITITPANLSGIDLENCVKMVNNTIQGLLGADIVGFHTLGYSRHMQRCIELFCDIEVSGSDSVSFQGRTVKIAKFPIGVDDSAWRALAATPEVQSRVAQIRAECDNRRIILSVDRLDYTKGTMFL